jgi:hypothetical protein
MALIKWSDELGTSEGLDSSGLEFQVEGFRTEFVPTDGSKLGFGFSRCVHIMDAHPSLPRELEIKYSDMEGYDPTTLLIFELAFSAFQGARARDMSESCSIVAFCDVMSGEWYSIGPEIAKGYSIPKEDKRLGTRFKLPLKNGVRRLDEARGKALVGRMLKVAMMKEASNE